MDSNAQRVSLTERNVHGALCAYKQTYPENKQNKVTTFNVFLKTVTPPQEEPLAGPSGGVLEEVIVTEDESSMLVIALEDFS